MAALACDLLLGAFSLSVCVCMVADVLFRCADELLHL